MAPDVFAAGRGSCYYNLMEISRIKKMEMVMKRICRVKEDRWYPALIQMEERELTINQLNHLPLLPSQCLPPPITKIALV